MKRIVIIGPANPYRGGIAAFNERLARQFITEGNEVEIITYTLQYPSFLFPGKTQFTTDPCPEGLKVVRKISSVNPLTWISVGRELRKSAPDIVIFSYWMSFMAPCFGIIAGIVRKNGKTKCIGLIHNMIPHEQKLIDKILPGYFVKRMNGFAALSDSTLKDIDKFEKAGKPKVASPHPIYDHYGPKIDRKEALQSLGLDPKFRYVLFFGFIRAYKGLDLLLEAMADPRLEGKKLIVAGEFYESPLRYTEIVKEKRIDDRVIFYSEYISDRQIGRFFGAADIVAQPYRTATQSGVTQVAYHFEKPMLVTKVGGLSEIVPEGKVGYNVDADPKSIADALVEFFDSGAACRLEEGIREEKKKYEWGRLTEKILSLC